MENNIASWRNIFYHIALQMKNRGATLNRRFILIALPTFIGLFLVVLFLGLGEAYTSTHSMSQITQTTSSIGGGEKVSLFFLLVLYFFVGLVLIDIVITSIFIARLKIEETLWIKAFFDNRELSPDESWLISKKIYKPWLIFQSKIFFRYYLPVCVLAVLFIYGYFILAGFLAHFPGHTEYFLLVYFLFTGLSLVLWTRYLKYKLAYTPFIFIDNLTSTLLPVNFSKVLKEVEALNKISRSEAFKKSILVELAGDTALSLEEHIASLLQKEINSLNSVNDAGATRAVVKAATTTINVASVVISENNAQFAELVGRGVVYQFAYKQLHGQLPLPNENIYAFK